MTASIIYLLELKLEVNSDFELQVATALGWNDKNPVSAAVFIGSAVKGYLIDKYVSKCGEALEKTAMDSVSAAKDALRDSIKVSKA